MLLQLRIVNIGNVPITPNDFIEPLVVVFPDDSNILQVDLFSEEETDIEKLFYLPRERTKLTFKPRLLNQGDFIHLQVLIDCPEPHVKVSARIVGVKKIRPLDSRVTVNPLARQAGWLAAAMGSVCVCLLIGIVTGRNLLTTMAIAAASLGTCVAIIAGFIWYRVKTGEWLLEMFNSK